MLFIFLLPGNVVKSGIHSCPFLTPSRTQFLLVRLIFMVVSTGIWCRFHYLACHRLQILWMVAKSKLAFSLMFKTCLCCIMVVHYWQKRFTLKLNMRVIRMAGNHLVFDQVVEQILGRNEAMGVGIPVELQSITSLTSSSLVVQADTLPYFLDQ